MDNSTVKASTKFYKTTLQYDMIFTKYDTNTSNEQVDKLTREFNIHFRACISSLIDLLSTRLYLIFVVHKLAQFSENPGKINFGLLIHLLRYTRDNKTLRFKYHAYMNDSPVYDLLRQASIQLRITLWVF